MQDLMSQDAVAESPDTAEAEIESSPEEQIEAEQEASTDVDAEHLEVSEEEAPLLDGDAAAEESPEPSQPQQPVMHPFSFTADRKRVDVEGASIVEHPGTDGNPTRSIVIPEATWQRVIQPHLADRGTFANKERDYKRQLDALSPDRNETVIRAQTLLEEFERVLSSEESLTMFLENFDQNRELLKLKVDKAAISAQLRSREDGERVHQTEHDQEETTRRVYADVPDSIQRSAEALATQFQVQVSPRVLQAAQAEIGENLGLYYRPATPEEAREYGVTVGEIVRDDDRIIRTLYRYATFLNDGSVPQSSNTEAAKKNAAALGKSKTPPPSVSAKGAAPAVKKTNEIKSREDFIRVMGGNF